MTLIVEARGVSVERFFGDINLSGTGLSGSLALSASLHWAEGGITRASGGGSITLEQGRAASVIRGRFGVPIGRRRSAHGRGRAHRIRGRDVPVPRLDPGVDRRPPDRRVDAGLRLPHPVPGSRRARPHLPELRRGGRQRAEAARARRQRRDHGAHRQVLEQPGGLGAGLGRERAVRQRALRQRAGIRRHARRGVSLPSPARLRGGRHRFARGHGPLPERSQAPDHRPDPHGEGLPAGALSRLPRSGIPGDRSGDRQLPALRESSGRRLRRGRRRDRGRGPLGTEGRAHHRPPGPDSGEGQRGRRACATGGRSLGRPREPGVSRTAPSRCARRATESRSTPSRACASSRPRSRGTCPSKSPARARSPSPT